MRNSSALHILNLNEKKIKVSEKVRNEMNRLRTEATLKPMPRNRRQSAVTVAGAYFIQLALQRLRSSVSFHLSSVMAEVFFYREMNKLSTADFYTPQNRGKDKRESIRN